MVELHWLAVPLGLGLIVLMLLDVFLTVLHTELESPLSNPLHRGLWRLLIGVSRGLRAGARDQLLSWGAPLMIIGNVVLWVTLAIVGFSGLYLPFIHAPWAFASDHPPSGSPLMDALYFSAATFFTIGYGDFAPIYPLARLVSVLEGGLGLLTISLAVTYLLSVYPVISRKLALATELNQETAGRSDGVVFAQRYLVRGRTEAIATRLGQVNRDLLAIGQAHDFYPVLYYVRPRDVHQSFVRSLALIQGMVIALRYGLDPAEHREVVDDPRLLVLEEGLLYTLHGLAMSSHLAPNEVTEDDARRADANFADLRRALERSGLTPLPASDHAAIETHRRFRLATDHYINAYAANSGYDRGAVWATFDRWERDSDLIGHADLDQSGELPLGADNLKPEDRGTPAAETRSATRSS